ncbi:MAG: monoterpene epsilon-lactone hydrolase [Hyphomicrobiaceae bacterium]|jgi:monoterpene epsilon-lactone hydrolase
MPSPEHEAIVGMLQSQPKPATAPSIEEVRAMFLQMSTLFPVPNGVEVEAVDGGGVPCEWVRMPETNEDRVVLYLHGGGYVIGSPTTHRSLVARIAAASGARVLSADYRLAPEHPFPAAVEDAVAAYGYLLAEGISPSTIVIAGDSAGGGLTLATLLALRDAGTPLPSGGVCLSPWTDLEGTGGSASDPSIGDPMIEIDGLRMFGELYGGSEMQNPLAAPLHASLAGLPSLLVLVGTREVLLDDSTRLAERAKADGVDLTLIKEEGLIHVWPLFGEGVPESVAAVNTIGAFIRDRTA